RPSAPPAIAERLLVLLLGSGEWAESIAGDLHEEHARLVGLAVPLANVRAHAWYWLLALRLGLRAGARRALPVHRRQPAGLPAIPPVHGDSLMRTLGLETRYALRAVWKR